MADRVSNPILPGFYPDPSVCRVGEDYYLVTSTFAYFPGVPVFHSKDLVNWKQIGNVLDREEQLKLLNARHSGGIFAPTIRYHDGTFYMITTNVSGGGNFIVTAKDPAGPWSNPFFLEGAVGIDPSLFFDEDGKCYYCGTKDRREGARYYGDNEIWVQELDLNTMKLVGESYAIWHGALRNVVWPEGPHIYKKDGMYYLLIAEAGTGHAHAVTIARGSSLREMFEGYNCNPILTHRHLGEEYPIVNVGHGDLVETQNGEWYMVTLASRPYGGYYRNLGRETFLIAVEWQNGWPVVNKGIGLLEETVKVPNLPWTPVEKLPELDDFNYQVLPYNYVYLRNPKMEKYSLTDRPGYMRLYLDEGKITELVSPSYIGIRQTGMSFDFSAKMDYSPEKESEEAGIVIIQNNEYNYRLVVSRKAGKKVVSLIRCLKGVEEVVRETEIEDMKQDIILRLTANLQDLTFSYSMDGTSYVEVATNVDGRILSTDMAGGFVGNTMGIYGSGIGADCTSHADFDWISYKNI